MGMIRIHSWHNSANAPGPAARIAHISILRTVQSSGQDRIVHQVAKSRRHPRVSEIYIGVSHFSGFTQPYDSYPIFPAISALHLLHDGRLLGDSYQS